MVLVVGRLRSVALLAIGLVLIAANAATAAPCDVARWARITGWTGTFTLTGRGSGMQAEVAFSIDHSIQGSLLAVSRSASLLWAGSMTAQVSIHDTFETFFPSLPAATTFVGSGTNIGPSLLGIDSVSCTYGVLVDTSFPVQVTDSGYGSFPDFIVWGPDTAPNDPEFSSGGLPITNIPLPASGTTLTGSLGFRAGWQGANSYSLFTKVSDVDWSLTWHFTPRKCEAPLPVKIGQGDFPWGTQHYDHSSTDTIKAKGCALTALSMALRAAGLTSINGEPLDPATLDMFMATHDNDYSGENVQWDKAVRDVSNPAQNSDSAAKLKFNTLGGWIDSTTDLDTATAILDEALCADDPHPVIVAVEGSDGSYPGHYVVVTGKEDGTYTIVNPATGTSGTLDQFTDSSGKLKFQTRGIVVDPPGDISTLDISIDNNASLIVTDERGRRTGFEPFSERPLQEIPGSAAFVDALTNDVTGASPSQFAHQIQIPTPAAGRYIIVVSGLRSGPFQMSISGFASDGGAQPTIVVPGKAVAGSTLTEVVNYDPTPGAVVSAVQLLGDRNGDGIVDCADLSVVKKSFGKRVGQLGFDPRADVNGDSVVDIRDLAFVARQLPGGTTCP